MERKIRNAAKALVIKDGKMLAIRIETPQNYWYIMPGGGQEEGESLPEAVCREVAEESGLSVKCGELLFVVEGVHGEKDQRVDLVFDCEYLGTREDVPSHKDANQAGVYWLPVENLNREQLYPSKLRRQIMNYYYGLPHPTYLGNEEIGDPECTD